jgi:peptide-methionine (S)-S-oxide reductase
MVPEEERHGLCLDAGWGERDPNLVATVSFEEVGVEKSQIQVGVTLVLASGMQCTVTQVTDETFTMDANPPLAGASYNADVKLLQVEAGPILKEYCEDETSLLASSRYQVSTFALGCFWGGELEFMREPGVVGTAVGYTQGNVENPTYKQVCSGSTGHTEAIAVTYDPSLVSYERLVHLAMDRLGEYKYLLNQVGNDRGTQYRHGVYYHFPSQRQVAGRIVQSFGDDCKTECLPATKFWMAEDYHQQYLLKGGQSARKGDDTVIRCYG